MSARTGQLGSRVLRSAARWCVRSGAIGPIRTLANRYERPGAGRGFPFVRRRRRASVQVLLFHRVTPDPDPFLPALPLREFECQMERLARSFHVLPLDRALDGVEARDVPDNAVVLTFDDGYRDNYDHAFPVLQGLGLPATVFLTTGLVGTPGMLWHDRVFRAFARTSRRTLGPIGEPPVVHDLSTAEARLAARDRVLEHLKTLHPRERDERIEDLLARLGDADEPPAGRLLLTWDEAIEMQRSGVSFGSHTVTHPVLSRISPDEVRTELVESRRTIERRLGAPCAALAYPNGRAADYSPAIKAQARDAGYRCAVTTVFGAYPAGGAAPAVDPFEIRRMGVREPDPDLFVAKMSLYKFAS